MIITNPERDVNINSMKKICNKYISTYKKITDPVKLKAKREYEKNWRKRMCKKFKAGWGTLWRYGGDFTEAVYKKYGRKCALCKSKSDLTFHHLNGKGEDYKERTGKPMDNRVKNIQVLCRRCHSIIEGKIKKLSVTNIIK